MPCKGKNYENGDEEKGSDVKGKERKGKTNKNENGKEKRENMCKKGENKVGTGPWESQDCQTAGRREREER